MFKNRLVSTLATFALTLYPASAAAADAEAAATPPAQQWWLTEYGFTEAWSVARGGGIRVAVIDTGIDGNHPDLLGKVVGGTDFSGVGTPDGLTPVGSASYHGTMVASLIAGQGQQSGGVWGVSPDAQLLSISIGLGVPAADTDAQVAAAIRWAVAADARIINLSLSRASADWPNSWDEALTYAFRNDVIVVAAIGAESEGVVAASAPGVIPGVVTVGALTRSGEPATSGSFELDVMAPGEDLLGSYPGGSLRSWGGASAAAPIVSGLLALILSAEPQLSANEAISILRASAGKQDSANFSFDTGYGAIDASAALTHGIPAEPSESPLSELTRWLDLYRPAGIDDPGSGNQSGQSLLVPPAVGAEITDLDGVNTQFSAESPWVIPLLLAVFGFSLLGSIALMTRRNETKKPEGTTDAKSARKRNSTRVAK